MYRALLTGCFLALATPAFAGNVDYPHQVARWHEITVPSAANTGDRMVWSYAANYSKHAWRVFADHGQICAALTSPWRTGPTGQRPPFTPRTDRFQGGQAFAAVDDGWLVGFNEGEFGAALYWFSRDGKQNYKVSDDQVVAFFVIADELYAIQGLAHLSLSSGSVIRIAKPLPFARWRASEVTKLPFAPYAISVRRDGTMLITLSDSLVSIGRDHQVTTLMSNVPWDGLYPNSSILSYDEHTLYIGMRQFVGEFDISKKKLRLLVPSTRFLNKLPKGDERQIRKQYSP